MTMRIPFANLLLQSQRDSMKRGAFSLIEMMVAVTLLLIIIAALLAVFYQTQRAFRLSATQVDVLEGGRAAMELLTAELPEITPSGRNGQINLYAETAFPFLVQPRQFPAAPRVNVIQDIFFLRQHNDDWIGTGYFVSTWPLTNSSDPIGTLYRFEETVNSANISQMPQLFTDFTNAVAQFPPPSTNSHRVMDRVMNFKLTASDARGSNFVGLNYTFPDTNNMALPVYLDLELGVLEPRAFEKYKSLADLKSLIPADTRAFQYLSNHVEKVHLFHQRIPIRTAQ